MVDQILQANDDPWYKFLGYVGNFNKVQIKEITFSLWDIADETASRPHKDKTGVLPNISFLIRKQELLGTKLKDTGDMVMECFKVL